MTPPTGRFDCSETHPVCRALRRDSRQQGVADPDNLPFMLCPPAAKTAVLLVHGFCATPWEMRPPAEALAEAGIASLAVRLPGHGTSPADLAGRRWEDWGNAVAAGLQCLDQEYPSVYGMGMSTGCLLLLAAAATRPLHGLVLFSPYLSMLHWLAPYAGWLRWVYRYHEKVAEQGSESHYYSRRPVAGIHQINRLTQSLRRQLPGIRCPVLAFNGEGDQTVDSASGRQLVDLLGSAVKIHMRYGPDVPHVLTGVENPCRQAMFVQAVEFVRQIDNPEPFVRAR